MIDTRTLDLYAAHPESVPSEYADRPLRDCRGRRLRVGSIVSINGQVLRITRRDGAWVELIDSTGEPWVRFVTELEEGAIRGRAK